MAKARLQELEKSGLMDLDPVTGQAIFPMIDESRTRRPKSEVTHRYYPDPNELMRKRRNVLATSEMPALGEAIQGVLNTDFPGTFGFTRQPLGNTMDPFIQLQMNPLLPFPESRIFPVLDDPKETELMYNRIRSAMKSTKYAAAKPEIDLTFNELQRYGGNYRLVMQLGLDRGAGYHYPTVEQAFRHSIMMESLATLPESADLSVARQRGGGERARSTLIKRRHAHLAFLRAKGTQPGGPLLADAINMYTRVLAPSLGWRSSGAPEPLLMPTFGKPTPLTEEARAKALKNLREIESHKARASASQAFRQMTDEEKATRLVKYIGERYDASTAREIMRNVGGRLESMAAPDRIKALLGSLHEVTGQGEAMGRNSNVLDAVADLGQLQKAAEEAGVKPSKQRITKAATAPRPETPRVGSNLVSEREAANVMKKTAKKLGVRIRNPGMVMAIAAILSAGFLAGMEEGA